MTPNQLTDTGNPRPAGYAALVDRYSLDVSANWHKSLISARGTHRVEAMANITRETYLPAYWPGEALGDQLEFALKYDGTNLAILASVFRVVNAEELTAYIQSKPGGKYARRLWFLYEFLTGNRLPLDDLKSGNYADLLEKDEYYTTSPARRVRRQRVNNNLLGGELFCPTIRRTKILRNLESADLQQRCWQILSEYPPELLRRALSYLYTKETQSSFEIEHIKPDASRTERFIALLQLAEHEDFCDKEHLIHLQNQIVDPRYQDADYRTSQNYVGQAVAWQQQRIHFVSPKPEDLPDLMAGLIALHQRMAEGKVHAVVHAAAIAYAFVFLHPFEDGNGRIHRFLIHNILARRSFTPDGLMFPVSAVMLKNLGEYDASLEAFSKPLMPLVEYSLDEEGRMVVGNDTAVWYRYMDMTPQAEALFAFIKKTIETELVDELTFLANYDRTKAAIQGIVDMPDRQINLFIRLCLQNNGRLSARKRASQFDKLTDEEVSQMERAVRAAYGEDVNASQA